MRRASIVRCVVPYRNHVDAIICEEFIEKREPGNLIYALVGFYTGFNNFLIQ